MTSFFGAVLLVIGITTLMKAFGLFPRALQAARTSRDAFEVMTDPECGDERKESLLQGYSLALLGLFVELLVRGVGSIALPVGLLWVLEYAGLLSLGAVLDLTRSWAFLLGCIIAATAAFCLLEK